ncbi:MAG: DUF1657 domain-containing protein [Firmicutes bacterium]|nr:DUF1657 domain-containing protein [Bacillota bacterium]
MTVGAQVKQTIASLKGARDTLETMAYIEENRDSRAILAGSVKRIGVGVTDMEKRLGVIEFEEPQYKGF